MYLIFLYLIAYLVGSIPFSFFIGKMWGVDIREKGSGNVGATNVWRNCGWVAGVLAYFADIGKGVLAGFISIALIQQWQMKLEYFSENLSVLLLVVFFLPILGHVFPIFLKFKGGKGVATSAGVLATIIPIPLFVSVLVFVLVFIVFRIISVSSIASALFLPLFYLWQNHALIGKYQFFGYTTNVQADNHLALFLILLCLSFFIIYKHKDNIKRLLAGEEYSFKGK